MQSAADALLAYKNGLDGIVVSNHGGRNMDTARPSLEVLIEVVAALKAEGCDRSKFQVRCVALAVVPSLDLPLLCMHSYCLARSRHSCKRVRAHHRLSACTPTFKQCIAACSQTLCSALTSSVLAGVC